MSVLIRFLKRRPALTGAAAAIALAAGGGAVHYSERALAVEQPAVPEVAPRNVKVAVLQPIEIRLWNEYSGRLEAVDQVEIKPRVGGTITDVLFEEGTLVEKGDPLFIIDTRPYEAAVDSAKAALQEAESEVSLAESELRRAKRLVAKRSTSESHFDTAQSAHRVALAKVAAAEAKLTQAELNHEYAHIRAPISGRINRAEMTVGNLVEAGVSAPVLTSIVSTEKLYAAFDVDEQTYLKTVRGNRGGRLPVELRLSGDNAATYQGFIHSFANQLDTTTGTIRARAIFDNSDGALLPGMFADIKLGAHAPSDTLLVSEKAVGTNQDQRYVYVVTPDNEIAYREVTLGRSVNGQRVVLSGLQAGERVLMNSLQHVQPGMKVAPVDAGQQYAGTERASG